MITLWYGSINNVPAGWSICDGTNGTPDLRGRFVIGVSNDYAYNSTGGSATASGTTSSNGAHTHTGSTGGHALTVAEMPSHNHAIYGANNTFDSNADGWLRNQNMGIPGEDVGPFTYLQTNLAGTNIIQNTGGNSPHTHSISSDGAHTHTLSNIATVPPYRALYYIMYTG
jgi:microcystin-dependent protein